MTPWTILVCNQYGISQQWTHGAVTVLPLCQTGISEEKLEGCDNGEFHRIQSMIGHFLFNASTLETLLKCELRPAKGNNSNMFIQV